MPIKNYTTTITPHRSVEQVQELLRKKGARRVMVEYDAQGMPQAVTFECELQQATGAALRIPFRIQARVEAMQRCLKKDAPPRFQGLQQAERVAWRLVRDWIDVQLAFIEAGQAEMAELLLGFALSAEKDDTGRPQTFFQILTSQDGPNLLAEHF